MRRLLTAALGLALITLAGCSGDADPAPAPASPSATTASPSPSPSPTPPVMPEAAKAHTEAGAKAFVEYFWKVVNYAETTGSTDAISALFIPGCKACEAGVQGIDELHARGAIITGGDPTVRIESMDLSHAGSIDLADVRLILTTAKQVVDLPGESQDQVRAGTTTHDLFHLEAEPKMPWRVSQFEVEP